MSKISAIYDRIPVVLTELFPDKTRIPYAYDISEKNNHRFLNDGYAFIIGDAVFEDTDFCSFLVARTVDIAFTKSLYRLDSSVEEIDSIVKGMLEDVYTLQKSFYNYNELDIPERIARVRINSVSAPEEIVEDSSRYLQMTASFTFDVYEKL